MREPLIEQMEREEKEERDLGPGRDRAFNAVFRKRSWRSTWGMVISSAGLPSEKEM